METTTATLIQSITDYGRVLRYVEFCRDLTEAERQSIRPYVQWEGHDLCLTAQGLDLIQTGA